MGRISENINRLREEITTTLVKSGLKQEVKLLAVTKGFGPEALREAYDCGQLFFAENYLQEALKKKGELDDIKDIEWHFIGGLQSNKARKCLENFSVIQSVDRENLAIELDKAAQKKGINDFPVLMEVNLAGEGSKSGAARDEVLHLAEKISSLKGIQITGLMTMPPYFDDPEKSRPYFIELRKLRDEIRAAKINRVSMKELSMGMSADYKIAVEEGSTMVRIGTAIFGQRPSR